MISKRKNRCPTVGCTDFPCKFVSVGFAGINDLASVVRRDSRTKLYHVRSGQVANLNTALQPTLRNIVCDSVAR